MLGLTHHVMGPGGEANDGRGSRWKPYISHVEHGVAVDDQLMPAGHRLSHVQQECVVALLCHLYGAGKSVALSCLPLVAVSRCLVYGLRLAIVGDPLQCEMPVAGIILGESIVVP